MDRLDFIGLVLEKVAAEGEEAPSPGRVRSAINATGRGFARAGKATGRGFARAGKATGRAGSYAGKTGYSMGRSVLTGKDPGVDNRLTRGAHKYRKELRGAGAATGGIITAAMLRRLIKKLRKKK